MREGVTINGMTLQLRAWHLALVAAFSVALVAAAWVVMTRQGYCGPFPVPADGGGSIFCGSAQERMTLALPLFWSGATLAAAALVAGLVGVAQRQRAAAHTA